MNKISFKLGVIYIFLVFLNIIFFTVMVFENQVDLIVDNAKFKTIENTDKIISSLDALNDEITTLQGSKDVVIRKISLLLETIVEEYIIFNERKDVFASSNNKTSIEDSHIKNAVSAAASLNFSGKRYVSEVERYLITYYIPFYSSITGDITISFVLSLKKIDNKMNLLYRQILAIVCILIVVHVVIGFVLNSIIIKPLMILKNKADDFSKGEFSARVPIKGNDELALVSSTFNSMAESVEQFIKRLKNQNDIINMELDVAAQVQQGIYPIPKANDYFDVSIYNAALEKVSGDFHDLIKLSGNKYGFFIADVSGHGVPAALITMKIKDLIMVTALKFLDPSALLKFFNNSFYDLMDRFSSYFTGAYLIYDWITNEILYSSAGHPESVIVRKNGDIELLKVDGFVIGVSKDMSDTFKTIKFNVNKGDCIIMYTDGITESRNDAGVFFGDKEFIDIIKSNAGESCVVIRDAIVSGLKTYINGNERKDDETIIVIEVK